jgi:hypothetical protein
MALGTRSVAQSVKEFVKAAHNGIESRYLTTSDAVDLMPYHAMNEDEQLSKLDA